MSQNTEYTVDPSRLVSPDAAPADAAEEMGMAFLKGRTLADEIEALATLTVDDVNKALQTMLLEENSAYIQIDPKE